MARRTKEDILRSACKLAELLLACPRTDIHEAHLNELLSTLIWKITEADGKYLTRYWSEGFKAAPDPTQAIHEHVTERRKLIGQLLNGSLSPRDLPRVAVACVVTRDEDSRLRAVGKHLDGWDRYKAANIRVWDRETACWLPEE